MNIEILQIGLEKLQKDLGASLLVSGVFGVSDGLELVTYNPTGANVGAVNAFSSNLLRYVEDALQRSDMPPLGTYFLQEYLGNLLGLVVNGEEYYWGSLIDLSKINLGLVLNVVIPMQSKLLAEALL
jgi:hypothetical protein